MTIYAVKLNAWASPVLVQASSRAKAKELALVHYPKCDCCGEPTRVESTAVHVSSTMRRTVIMEIKKG